MRFCILLPNSSNTTEEERKEMRLHFLILTYQQRRRRVNQIGAGKYILQSNTNRREEGGKEREISSFFLYLIFSTLDVYGFF